MTEPNDLRQKLLALDSAPGAPAPGSAGDSHTRYESEIKAMFEQTLSTTRRILHAIGALLCGAFGLLVLTGVLGDEGLPWVVQTIGWFTVAGTGGFMLINAYAAIRGRWHRRTHSQLLMFIAGVMMAGMGLVFLRVGAEGFPDQHNAMLQVTGWIFLGLLAVSVLMHYMEEQQLKTQAKLLELELRLAEIAERLNKS